MLVAVDVAVCVDVGAGVTGVQAQPGVLAVHVFADLDPFLGSNAKGLVGIRPIDLVCRYVKGHLPIIQPS